MRIKGALATAGTALMLIFVSGSAQAAFPGDNGLITFDDFDGESASRVYVVEPDGSGLTPMTEPEEGVSNYDPVFGPAGEKIAYTRYDADSEEPGLARTQIHIVNLDGTGDIRLTSGELTNSEQPSFSPDGQKIVFSEPSVGSDGIASINTDGTGYTQLFSANFSLSPAYSPDGSQIAFFGPTGGLWLMEADGSDPHEIAPSGLASRGRPSFSPDGSRIAFGSMAVEAGETTLAAGIHSVKTDGTDRTVEVPTALPDQPAFPAYSPDGEYMVYSSEYLDFPYTDDPPPRSIKILDLATHTSVTVPVELTWIEQVDWGISGPRPPSCETDSSLCPPPSCETDPSLCPPPPPPVECETEFTKANIVVFDDKPAYRLVTKYRSATAGKVKISVFAQKADGSKGKALGKLTGRISNERGRFRVTKKVGGKRIKKLRRSKHGFIADFRTQVTSSEGCQPASLPLTELEPGGR